MKSLLVVSTLAAIALAGCASYGDDQYAKKADCKVYPITTASATGNRPSRVDDLAQKDAEMQLATTQFRRQQLQRQGIAGNTIEEALRDCY
jgi:outer membrane lipoprotein SlyB